MEKVGKTIVLRNYVKKYGENIGLKNLIKKNGVGILGGQLSKHC